MILKFKKLHSAAMLPRKAHPHDAGLDLFAIEDNLLKPQERKVVSTGISLEIPAGFVGLIWDKSGIAIKEGIKTLGGVIDAGYRGEILVGMINLSDKDYVFKSGHKIAQLIVQKIEDCEVVEVDELSQTIRGGNGFGSTGK